MKIEVWCVCDREAQTRIESREKKIATTRCEAYEWANGEHIYMYKIEQNAIYMNNKIENSIWNAFKCNEAFMFHCL